ncbi:MAG: alpha/beta fold hydrolase [Candidatus Omnitrophica bacterium]|nr:alpha/beta fold hydrolase [Candidatus Omnitrophota bacterium]
MNCFFGLAVGIFLLGRTVLSATPLAVCSSPPFYADRTNLLVVIDEDGVTHPIRTDADWQRRREHILANLQLVMGPLPIKWKNLPLEPQVVEEVVLPKCVRKKITYRAEPDDLVTAYLLIPRTFSGKRPAMLCLHQTTEIGKDEPAGLGGSPDLHYALELAERGYVTLAPDYWSFGDYRHKAYDPYQHGYVSGTMKGIWNHIRAVDLLESLPEVDSRRIGCIGHSLGGHNALWLAAFDARIKVVVSSCGFNSMSSYAASPYGGGDLRNYAQRRYMPRVTSVYGNDPRKLPFDWPEVLAVVATRPLFINAPLNDMNFVVSGVNECVDAVRPVYQWKNCANNLAVIYPRAEHSFPADARAAAYAFIDRALCNDAD